ncbi:MAG: alpha/beta hydrolase [Marmoricola sp.]
MASTRDRFERRLLRTALGLPPRVQRLLAGAPVVREGQTLSTETQLMLRLESIGGVPPVETLPWAEGRVELDRQGAMVGGRQPIGSIRDLEVPGAEGPLPARLYTPTTRLADDAAPTMLFLHGGGMTYGGLRSHDAAARHLAENSGVQLLAVEYRLAPEHPFPACVDDAAAAYAWLVGHAAEVGADAQRLAVGGDSAGGYLAATTAIRAAEQELPLRFQLLVYPCTDFVEASASRRSFGEGFFLTNEFIDRCTDAFFPPATDREAPLASIGRRESFPDGLAPAYVVTAGFDPLRDEGEAYGHLLAEHGVEVELRRYPSMIHGFFNVVGVGREPAAYNREIAARLAAGLA